jgi:hypothetical protein
MSNFPPPPPPPGFEPIGYITPQVDPPPRRPTVVTVLAAIGICWGVFSVLSGLYAIASNAYTLKTGMMPLNNLPSPMSQGIVLYTFIMSIVSLGLAALLLAASIGSIRLSGWSRKGMILWAWCTVVLTFIGLAITLTHQAELSQIMKTAMNQQMQQQQQINPQVAQQTQAMTQSMMQVMSPLILGAAIACPLILLIYPIWILATFGKPRVRSAFERTVV